MHKTYQQLQCELELLNFASKLGPEHMDIIADLHANGGTDAVLNALSDTGLGLSQGALEVARHTLHGVGLQGTVGIIQSRLQEVAATNVMRHATEAAQKERENRPKDQSEPTGRQQLLENPELHAAAVRLGVGARQLLDRVVALSDEVQTPEDFDKVVKSSNGLFRDADHAREILGGVAQVIASDKLVKAQEERDGPPMPEPKVDPDDGWKPALREQMAKLEGPRGKHKPTVIDDEDHLYMELAARKQSGETGKIDAPPKLRASVLRRLASEYKERAGVDRDGELTLEGALRGSMDRVEARDAGRLAEHEAASSAHMADIADLERQADAADREAERD